MDILALAEETSLVFWGWTIIAAILSWKRNKDFLWMVVAAILGPLYVIYWVITEIAKSI